MNFNVVEGSYVDLDGIYDSFVSDYVFSTELSNMEIRRKYNLTHSEFKEISEIAKKEYDLTRRPIKIKNARYYYALNGGFVIMKCSVYIGFVHCESVARKIVELCKKVQWDIDECRRICKDWKAYA